MKDLIMANKKEIVKAVKDAWAKHEATNMLIAFMTDLNKLKDKYPNIDHSEVKLDMEVVETTHYNVTVYYNDGKSPSNITCKRKIVKDDETTK